MEIIPTNALEQHLIILGKTGAGKSYALRGIIESLIDDKKRVCIIDPKGDHWGIKLNQEGNAAGYPFIVFGGDHSDIPLNSKIGKEVAELIATGNRPSIIDFRGWMPGERTSFWIDFSSTLFRLNRSPLWLIIDEVHNFAPQGKVIDPQAGKSLHWTNRIASEGRGIGIRLFMASQRPQKVHKDTLTCAETLIAMRVVHPLDRKAMKDWVDGIGDPEKGSLVMNSIASLKRGEAFVWSPEIQFFKKITFPLIKTFDSFKAPTSKQESLSGWASVNIEDVKNKLAKTIEEIKENDPLLLKRKIRELEGKLKKNTVSVIDENAGKELIELKKQNNILRTEIKNFNSKLIRYATALKKIIDIASGFTEEKIANIEIPEVKIIPNRTDLNSGNKKPKGNILPRNTTENFNKTTGGALKMLRAAAMYFPKPITKARMASIAGLSYKSGTFGTYLASLKRNGFLEGDRNTYTITELGMIEAGDVDPIPSGFELVQMWCEIVGSGAARMLNVLSNQYPNSMLKDELGKASELSSTSGTFGTYLATLKRNGLIKVHGSEIKLSDELFGI